MKFPKPILASLLGFSIMLTGCHREAPSPAPENVTLLIEDENRILTLGFSEYLAGCIFAAADPSFQEETLLAAGIALSSQAQYCMKNCEADFGADLADRGDIYPDWLSPDELEERYADQYPEWLERVSRVAERAAKACLYYNDGPAYTPCCRVSSGVTDDGGFTYLPALKLSRDPDSPEYSASSEYTCTAVRKLLAPVTGSVVLPADKAEWFSEPQYTKNGTLRCIRFGGVELTGEQLREALGLRSAAVAITQEHDSFIFRTRGSGGGVGMSVYTADLLARSGLSVQEILQQFYPGTELID